MDSLDKAFSAWKPLQRLISSLSGDSGGIAFPCQVDGAESGATAFVINQLFDSLYRNAAKTGKHPPRLLAVVPGESEALALQNDLLSITGRPGTQIPWWGMVPYSPSPRLAARGIHVARPPWRAD